jgi:predicted DNA-binding protein (UPF0251 family)
VTEQSAQGFCFLVIGHWSLATAQQAKGLASGQQLTTNDRSHFIHGGNYGNGKHGNHGTGVEVLRTLWRAVAANPRERRCLLCLLRAANFRFAGRAAAEARREVAKQTAWRSQAASELYEHFAAGRECVMGKILFLTANANGEQEKTPHDMESPIAMAGLAKRAAREEESDYIPNDSDVWLYRDRTIALLRRYFRISIEVGRLPSLVGREVFRGRVTAYRMRTFEDAVIFVHDVEHGLERLDAFERELIGKIIFQEYTHDEAAHLMGCWRRTVGRRFAEALDRLSEIFLEGGVLSRFPAAEKKPVQSCQEEESGQKSVSVSMRGK